MATGIVLRGIIGTLIGGGAGFLLYKTVGCSTGACPITANPWTSVIYGAVIGLLFTIGK